MEETLKEKIIIAVKTVINFVDPRHEVIYEELSPNFYIFTIKTTESSLLIGREGANIGSIDHLIKMLLRKDALNAPTFIIDINNYRRDKIERLRQIAKSAALRVSWQGKPETLSPMSALERRIIHMELSNSPLVETKSVGADPHRSVVINPLNQKKSKKSLNIDEIINS